MSNWPWMTRDFMTGEPKPWVPNAPYETTSPGHGYSESSSSGASLSPPPPRKRQKQPRDADHSAQGQQMDRHTQGTHQDHTAVEHNVPDVVMQASDIALETLPADLTASAPIPAPTVPAPAISGPTLPAPTVELSRPIRQVRSRPRDPYDGMPPPPVPNQPYQSSSFPTPVSYSRNDAGTLSAASASTSSQDIMPAALPISSTDILLGRAHPSELTGPRRPSTFPASVLASRPQWLEPDAIMTEFMPSGQILPLAWLNACIGGQINPGLWYKLSLEIGNNALLTQPLFKEGIMQFAARQRQHGRAIRVHDASVEYRLWADDPNILVEWLPQAEAKWKRHRQHGKSLEACNNMSSSLLTSPVPQQQIPPGINQTQPGNDRGKGKQSQQFVAPSTRPQPNPTNTEYEQPTVPLAVPLYEAFPGLQAVTAVELHNPRPVWLGAHEWCTRHPSNEQVVPISWLTNPFEDGTDLATYLERGRSFENNRKLVKPLLGESFERYIARWPGVDYRAVEREYMAWAYSRATDSRWVPQLGDVMGYQ